ncbi:hypothetical protein BGW80DRAFT_1393806 [Lactifluus volemus]|nr:hypothetical protein BGW80DRAFT_1393806 [Lactifluus volemus]
MKMFYRSAKRQVSNPWALHVYTHEDGWGRARQVWSTGRVVSNHRATTSMYVNTGRSADPSALISRRSHVSFLPSRTHLLHTFQTSP